MVRTPGDDQNARDDETATTVVTAVVAEDVQAERFGTVNLTVSNGTQPSRGTARA